MRDTVISAESYGFTYASADEPQLRDLTFDVRTGERVAIMGATGAGKTTLAMSLNGLIPHHHEGSTTGTIRVAGMRTADVPIAQLVQRTGLVMQDAEAQITGRRARDDAAVGPANLGLSRTEVFARADAALAQVGLSELADRDTAQMSGGQQQRLAIAGILAMRPGIMVLDEPTSELDPAGTEQVFTLVQAISAEADRTVVMIEHEPELVAMWADRLLVLVEGRLVFNGPPAQFFAEPNLVRSAGLRAPGVTDLILALQAASLVPPEAPLPITVDQAADLLTRLKPLSERGRPTAPQTSTARRPAHVGPEAPVVLAAENLCHRYPSGVDALQGVDLQIRSGEFVALLGRNGAGKTTFARHLNGLLRPTDGCVRIHDRPTGSRPLHELATEVGYVFQNPDHQIFATSVREEIAFGLRNLGHDEAIIEAKIARVLEQVGMPELADVHPYRLGKGQRQRLAVASVLALEPDILVIDEPTTGQDWTGSVALLDLVRELNQSGHTIVMITHDMVLASQYARRAVIFDSGIVRADLPIGQVFTDADLLYSADLRPPQVTQLADRLGLAPCSSVAEFVEAWSASCVA